MTTSIRHTRGLLIRGATGLVAVAAIGGVALSATEGTSYVDGLTLAFSTVSTTGFGPGPQSNGGLAVMMLVFGAGAACWFAIIVAAFETGLRRTGTFSGGNGYTSTSEPASLEMLLHRRRGGRG